MILQPLDVPNPDRVMTFAPHAADYPIFSYPEVRDVRDGNTRVFCSCRDTITLFGLEADGVTRPVWGYEVSGQYFEVVAIKPFLGRLLERADDDHPGASEAAVLTWPAWKNYFGADPNIVGKTVRINKHPYTIVGVTPEGFYGTEKFLQPDIFVPMANQASLDGVNWLESRRAKTVFPIVRIKDGITLTQVQAELDTIAARIRKQYPAEEDGAGIQAGSSRSGRRLCRRGGAPFSGWRHGPGGHCTAGGLRQPRQPVRSAYRRPHSRDRHPPGRGIEPLARAPPGPGRGPGDFASLVAHAPAVWRGSLSLPWATGVHPPTTR